MTYPDDGGGSSSFHIDTFVVGYIASLKLVVFKQVSEGPQ